MIISTEERPPQEQHAYIYINISNVISNQLKMNPNSVKEEKNDLSFCFPKARVGGGTREKVGVDYILYLFDRFVWTYKLLLNIS